MKPSDRCLLGVGLLCAAAIVAVALCLPGARLSFLLPAAAFCAALPLCTFMRCPFRSTAGWLALMLSYTLVVCGIIWNIHYFTVGSGGTYDYPVLHNLDALTDWSHAVTGLYGDELPEGLIGVRYLNFIGRGLMAVFGRDIGVVLMFNALCYPFILIIMGAIAWELAGRRSVATATMIVTALMCYLTAQATLFLKDVPLTLCVAAAVLVMVRWRKRSEVEPSDFYILVPALVGMSFLRANFLLMMILGALMMCRYRSRFDVRFIYLASVCAALFIIMHMFFSFPSATDNIGVARNEGVFVSTPGVMAWDNMLGSDYDGMSVGQRLLWLPASVVVQFLIPFPWNFERDMCFGPADALAHFGFFWYYAGALLLYYIFAARKGSPSSMLVLVAWGVLLTVATAYMMSGRVSRYCLPYLPMLLPAVGYTAVCCCRRRSLWIWLGVFTLLLVPTLIICHHLQMSAA